MVLEKKGMLAPFTIITSFITGIGFPLLGSLIALDLGVIKQPYTEGIILVLIGGFLAQWTQAHTIHDLYHYDKDERITLSKKSLKTIFVISTILLFIIMIYLTIQRGWPILVFAIIGAIVSMYAEGLIHIKSGIGESRRFSTTIKEDFLYIASVFNKNDSKGIMRLSIPLSLYCSFASYKYYFLAQLLQFFPRAKSA